MHAHTTHTWVTYCSSVHKTLALANLAQSTEAADICLLNPLPALTGLLVASTYWQVLFHPKFGIPMHVLRDMTVATHVIILVVFLAPAQCSSVQSLSVSDSAILWTAAHQASLSITISQSLLKLMSVKSLMPSNPLMLCHPLLLLPSILPSIRVRHWTFLL